MLDTAPTLPFDYSALEAESRIVVRQKTAEIRDRVKRAADDIVAIGERLLIVKGHLEGNGFHRWLETEFQWDLSHARRLMAVATRLGPLNLSGTDIGPSALYLLASDTFTDDERAEAVDAARGGEKITHAAVKAQAEAKKAAAPKKSPVRHVTADAQPLPDDDVNQAEPEAPAVAPPVHPDTLGDDFDSLPPAEKKARLDAADPLLAKHRDAQAAKAKAADPASVTVTLSESAKASAAALVARFSLPFLAELVAELRQHIEGRPA